jgi:HK97 family phage portal protein
VIVRARGGANTELRVNGASFTPVSSAIPTPSEWGGSGWSGSGYYGSWLSSAGEPVNVWTAVGIPGVLKAIRIVAGATASIPVRVYSGRGADKRPADASWQWKLLHDRPNDEQSSFDFWWDVAVSVETHGNAYILKDKLPDRVLNLYPVDPGVVRVERAKGTLQKLFVVRTQDGDVSFTADEVLHVRGITLKGGMDAGLSPIRLEREALGSAISRYGHEGASYANGAVIPFALRTEQPIDRRRAQDMLSVFMATHGGPHSGTPAVLGSGGDIVKLGLTMEDAQFIQSHEYGVKDIARMFNMPASILGGEQAKNVEQETTQFLSFGLRERLDRIRSAVQRDLDLFPATTGLYPEHYVDDFIRIDASTKDTVIHQQVQDGRLLIDEARADMGRPPLPNGAGEIPQITPVGGAPNPAVGAVNGNGNGNGNSADS